MSNNSLILKMMTGGIIITGGTMGAGSYFAHKKGFFDSEYKTPENTEILDYLIVKSVDMNDNNHKNNDDVDNEKTEMYEKSMFSFKVKVNFFCSLTSSSLPKENCEIYKLSDSEKQLGSLITNNYSATNENVKKAGNFFKIKISKELQEQIDEYNNVRTTINILKKYDEPNVDDVSMNHSHPPQFPPITMPTIKKFAEFIPIYRVQNGKIIDRSKSVLFAKTSSVNANNNSLPDIINEKNKKNYQCQIKTKQFDCYIKSMTYNQSNKSFYFSNWSYSGKNTNLPTKSNLAETNKYFQIKINEDDLKNIDFSKENQEIDIIAKPNNPNQKYATLKPEFFALDNQIFNKDKNFYWIVKKNKKNNTNEIADTTWKEKYTTCNLVEKNIDFQCEIYKWDAQSEPESSGMTMDLDFSKKLSLVEDDSIKDEKYYVIKLKTKNESEYKSVLQQDTILLKSATPNKKTYLFMTWSQLVGNITSNNPENIFVIH